MKISWQRRVTTQLRMPPVCAATGAPASKNMPIVFRNRYSYYLPGIGRSIMNLVNRFAVLSVPLSEEVGKKVLILRLVSLASIFGGIGIGIGIGLAVGVGDAASLGLFFLFVNSDVISMRTAHPRFVQPSWP